MRQKVKLSKIFTISALASGLLLAGCGDDGDDGKDGKDGVAGEVGQSVVVSTTSGFAITEDAIFVAPDAVDGDDITEALSLALFDLSEDALVVLPKGRFVVTESIVVNSARGLTLSGHGINETILDFSTSNGDDAFRFQGGNGITVRDLGVYEAPKNGIKTTNVNGIHITYTATVWEGDLEANNGAYGLYPLKSQNVLMENNYAFGSADAGIYVGQSENIVVRNNTAKQNVAGIEIENSTMADVYNNIAVGNSGGILVFDLPGLDKAYGGNVRVFNNQAYNNNADNVGAGVVGMVPPGTGVLVLATSDVEIYNNQITDNETTAAAITSYLLVDDDVSSYAANYGATIANGWSPTLKNVYLHNNTIARNGANPRGALLAPVIGGYTSGMNSSGMAQTFPAILYGGIGELLSNTGTLGAFNGIVGPDAAADGVNYDPYGPGDLICANSNINGNAAPDYENVNTGLVYPTNPADLTLVDGDGNPQPHLLIDRMVNNTYLNCVQPRLAPAEVNFRNTIYGCTGDDLAEAACAL
ncbi:parallel beta-helix domain-containing protein [Marinobacter sp. 2_MG-2023]|uniref:parallel beta-helix domain-containing protein n=1 Tax=Marinobacter sp. 2_MG-2023 TaxID=3062679 RepID=UPI0026E29B49|nr:parallel beta-helix domain-containing protein [Marinobacter sp. 2_MG-2023]MDO6443351.1 parallel beta-helix domain-containing protein [Marinobacter sp. 2_MG-2023]